MGCEEGGRVGGQFLGGVRVGRVVGDGSMG